MTERIKYIDIAKAIGIIGVVFGHLYMWLKVPDGYYDWVKIVHMYNMPMFFLMAGLNFKLAKEHPFMTAFFKRAKGIAKPYIIWCIVISGYTLIAKHNFAELNADIVIKTVIGPLAFSGNFVGSWFFTCLFWASLLTIFLIIHFKPKPRMVILFALGITGMLLPEILPENIFAVIHKIHRLDVALVGALLIGIGYSIKDKIDYGNNIFAAAALLIAAGSVVFNIEVNMNGHIYGSMFLFLTGALSGSYLIMYISKKIEIIPYVSPALCYIGKQSMWILFFHEGISRLLNYIFGANKTVDGVIMHRLVLYVVAAVALPPLVIYIYGVIKGRLEPAGAKLKVR